MNKKQLIVAWSKKFLAFVLDIIIAYPLILISQFVIIILLSPFVANAYLDLVKGILDISLFIIYFFYLPTLIGNTFGRKIFKIKDRYTALVVSPVIHLINKLNERKEVFPAGHLKKDGVFNVEVKHGQWICPSCNENNKALHDVCSNCGQEIEKYNE
jgi:hypothetical protein